MRISRGCYDKFHRCPGWAGGGMKYAKVSTCESGSLTGVYDRPGWKWRFTRCPTCGMLVLPYVTRYVDPTWLRRSAAVERAPKWLRQYRRSVRLLHDYGEAAWPWNIRFVWSAADEGQAPYALERTPQPRQVVSDEEYAEMERRHVAELDAMEVPEDEVCNRCLYPVRECRCYWPLRKSDA